MRKLAILVNGAVLAVYAITAQAAIKFNATRTTNFASSAAIAALPLNNAGATAVTFNLPANKKMVLTYSAECAAAGTVGWVEIDIFVNGVAVAPTVGGDDAFCSPNHTTGFDGFVRAAITIQIQGIAGTNSIRITGRNNGTTSMWFGNSALLVFD